MPGSQAVTELEASTSVVGDAIWFGFPLREGLSDRTVVDFELADGPARVATGSEVRRALLEFCAGRLEALGAASAIVPLSGGLDSRLVLGTLLELLPAKDIHCYSYGFKGHLDYDIAPLVARAAGVPHVQRGFHELAFDPDEFEVYAQRFDVESAPFHNLFSHYYTEKITELCLAELPPGAAIWSGFLGDRAWAGKWLSDSKRDLQASAAEYALSYSQPSKAQLVAGKYDPVQRLVGLYADMPVPPDGTSWCERMDLQQRQYYVKRSLQVSERQYVFPLAAPAVVSQLLSLPSPERAAHRFYRRYAHEHHARLFDCPTSTRFGAPLRASQLREQLDRGVRLARGRLEQVLGVSLSPFEARRYNTRLVEETWPRHREAVRRGLERTGQSLEELGFESRISDDIFADRAASQTLASLGYLL